MSPVSRRTLLSALLAGLGASTLARHAAARTRLRALALFGPPAGPSVTLAYAVAAGRLAGIAETATFRAWRDPDEVRAGLASGTMPLVIMPTTVAANLYTRGLGVRLVNVMTDGLLYFVSADPSLTSFPALAGRRLVVPFRGDTPEFTTNRLLRHHRLEPGKTITVETAGTPIEAVQLVLAGRMDVAVVPEPAAAAAIFRAAAAGRTIHRVMSMQAEWAKMTGGPPSLPQAGLAVTDAFLNANRQLVDDLHAVIVAATAQVIADPAKAAAAAAAPLDLPAPVIAAAIPFSNLVAVRARDARPSLEMMFRTVADADASIIGGRLPDHGFYL